MSTDPETGGLRPAGLAPDAAVAAIVAHRNLRARLNELMGAVDPTVADRTVVPACPGWTVTETLAHLVGVCIDIAEGNIGDDVGTSAWADTHPARFASLGVAALLDRWAEVGPVIDSLEGLMPPLIASQFVFDATSHEQDIRGALDAPGGRDSDGIEVGLGFIEDRLDFVLRQHALAPMRWVTPAWSTQMGEGDDPIRLEATPFELFRAFGGRRSRDQIRAMSWSRDPEAHFVLLGLGPLDPPVEALVE